MPSPIAHTTVGYVVYCVSMPHSAAATQKRVGPFPLLLLATTAVSLLPDADSAVGLLAGDFGRFHNNVTHSLLVGVAVAIGVGLLLRRWQFGRLRFWFLVTAAAYSLHVLMDAATIGRGVLALWPLTAQRYHFPLTLFYGLHWSDGWLSQRHLWTLITELAFAAVVVALLRWRRAG